MSSGSRLHVGASTLSDRMPHSLTGRLWRWIAGSYLVIGEPLWQAVVLEAALPRLLGFGVPALLLVAGRVGVTAIGVAAGLALWRREPAAALLGRVWASSSLIVAFLVWLSPYFPDPRSPSEGRLALAAAAIFYLAWWAGCSLGQHSDRTDPGVVDRTTVTR